MDKNFWWGANAEPKISNTIYYGGDLQYSPRSLLFKNRIIKLSTAIDDAVADVMQDWLLALDAMDFEGKKHQNITLYINSPGGSVISGLSIYDTMQHIKSPVITVCTGLAASMASVILAAGETGKRYVLPNSTVMIHQLSHNLFGTLRDTTVGIEYGKKLEDRLLDIYVKHAPKNEEGYITCWGGNPDAPRVEDVKGEKMKPEDAKEWLRVWVAHSDRYLDAEQAVAMGFADKIVKIKEMPHYTGGK